MNKTMFVMVAGLSLFFGNLIADPAPVDQKNAPAPTPIPATVQKSRLTKIAVIDPQNVMKECDEWADMVAEAEKGFQKRYADLQKQQADFNKKASAAQMANDREVMKDLAKLQKDLEIEEQDLKAYSQQIQQELQMAIAQKVDAAIEKVAQEQGWDAVFPRFFYATPEIDITKNVIEKMNKLYRQEKAANKFKKDAATTPQPAVKPKPVVSA